MIGDLERLSSALTKCKIDAKDGNLLPKPELALRRAANAGRLDLVQAIVETVKDLNINEPGPDSGNTALDFAESKGHEAVVSFLKARGAKVRTQVALKSE